MRFRFEEVKRLRRLAILAFTMAGLVVLGMLVIFLAVSSPDVQAAPPVDEASPDALGTLVVAAGVDPDAGPIAPGDRVTFTIEVTHSGGGNSGPVVMSVTVPSGLNPGGPKNIKFEEKTPTVSEWTTAFKQGTQGTRLQGKGIMSPNAKFEVSFPARAEECQGVILRPLTATVAVKLGGQSVTQEVGVEVACNAGADPSNLNLSTRFGYDIGGFQPMPQPLLLPAVQGLLRLEIENTDTEAATLALVGVFPSRNLRLGPPDGVQRLPGLGFNIGMPPTLNGASPDMAEDRRMVFFRIEVDGGATSFFDIWTEISVWANEQAASQGVAPGDEFVFQYGYCLTEDGRTCPGAEPESSDPPPSFHWLDPLTVTVAFRDLGDAPDSSNHPGSPMPAYPSVQAFFPTVYDPATGLPQGPMHIRPRPFHLGKRVSGELEADVGPDLDPSNNLRPGANKSNLDRWDDGTQTPWIAFGACEKTYVPVQVLIQPWAVNYLNQHGGKGYLNAWVDGTRDGDWADSGPCTTPEGQNVQAFEHIIIDHELDIATLGPGLHNMWVPTGHVVWPADIADKPAWLRLTLSERPSNKPLNAAGVDYGDGRGFAKPFELGETEDYYFRPKGDPNGGKDLEIDLFTRVRPVRSSAAGAQSTANEIAATQAMGHSRVEVAYRVRNIGNTPAFSYNVELKFPPGGQITFDPSPRTGVTGQLEGDSVIYAHKCPTCGHEEPDPPKTPPKDKPKDPPETEPSGGGGGTWRGCLTCTLASAIVPAGVVFEVETTVIAPDDVNPGNDAQAASLEPGLPAPVVGILDWLGSLERYAGSATTCRSDVVVGGRYLPGSTMHIFTDGFESGDVSVSATGVWTYPLTLTDGLHRIRSRAESGGDLSPFSTLLRVNVNPDLLFDPVSLSFTDSKGNAFRPAVGSVSDMMAQNMQSIFVPGRTYVVSVKACDLDPDLEMSFEDSVRTAREALVDPDKDGVYVGSFTAPDGSLVQANVPGAVATTMGTNLVITDGSTVATYGGTLELAAEGVVYDDETGQRLAGAKVTAWQGVATSGDSAQGFDHWPGEDYGQANPQTTGVDGAFLFAPPKGEYRLTVTKAGYQDYQSGDLFIVDEWLNLEIPLSPVVEGEADHRVFVNRNGFEPSVLTAPSGSVVEFVNADVKEHSSTHVGVGLNAGAGDWDSGALQPGASFRIVVGDEGTYEYYDRTNPINEGTIIAGPSAYQVFLPLVIR